MVNVCLELFLLKVFFVFTGVVALIDKFYHREHRDGNTNPKLQKSLKIMPLYGRRKVDRPLHEVLQREERFFLKKAKGLGLRISCLAFFKKNLPSLCNGT
jgi:hypothetical protein